MNKKSVFIIAVFAIFVPIFIFGTPQVIPVGQQLTDTSGALLQAHGGGILKYNGYYYWFGENRNGDAFVSCYRSLDFKNWEFRNHVLRHSSASELSNANIERPKVIYNQQTNTFVMWMHKELSSDYSQARAAVATCSTVDGNYVWQRSFQPLSSMSRDCTTFIDDNGTAYFISSANENMDLHIYKLTSNYQDIDSLVYNFVGFQREAPAMFKNNGKYYLVTSGATGWSPNQGKYASATNLAGPWSAWQNFGNTTTYDSQAAYIQPIQGSEKTSYLYMGDRWAGATGGPVNDSKYVWLPINIDSSGNISISYSDSISIDTDTGVIVNGQVVVDPANIAYNKSVTASSAESGNPASNGNDGITGTRWCATSGNTGEWWKVDLGQGYAITEVGVLFEFADSYQYLIEGSTDNSSWFILTDQRSATGTAQQRTHAVSGTARYVRITITGLASGRWASLFEFSVKAGSVTTAPTAAPTSVPTPVGMKGDVNNSGTVDIVDALMIAQSYVGLNPAGFNAAYADVNCSGGIDIVDALLVAQYYVGLISNFPC
jgi:hypothetical protein